VRRARRDLTVEMGFNWMQKLAAPFTKSFRAGRHRGRGEGAFYGGVTES